MNKALLLAIKDLRVLLSDKGNIFWVFGFPVLFALFFGAIYSGIGKEPSGMKIAVVDEDNSDYSNSYISRLDSYEALTIVRLGRDEAIEKIRTGKIAAAVFLAEGFGDNLGAMFGGGENKLEIASDPSRKMESGYLQGLLAKAQFESLSDKFSDSESFSGQIGIWRDEIADSLDQEQTDIYSKFFDSLETLLDDVGDEGFKTGLGGGFLNVAEVKIERENKGPISSFQITFPQAMIWGILGCTATFAISIVKERTNGTFARLRVGPIGRAHILGGKGLACFATCIFIMCVQYAGAKLIFKMPIGNLFLLVLAAVCTVLCFVGLMMFVCTLGRTEQSVGGAGWAILMIMSMLGGGMVPLIFMPSWLRPFSHISPVRWSIFALEGAVWRNLSLTQIISPCLVLLAIGFTFFSLGVFMLRRQDN
ncbi:MAG TPA: ABC transporter permease [Sedimentisphaerales bacterium]|nr:ABC transporter permease [Sedimentisphaerales bacterium]